MFIYFNTNQDIHFKYLLFLLGIDVLWWNYTIQSVGWINVFFKNIINSMQLLL